MSNGKITPAIGKAADAIQAEIKAHPTFDPQPFGAMGTFPLGATMFDLARAAFRSLDVEEMAKAADPNAFREDPHPRLVNEYHGRRNTAREHARRMVAAILGDES